MKKEIDFSSTEFINNIDELMKRKMEADRKAQEELLSQNWPIWLFPQQFDSWFKFENWCRQTEGKMRLPPPPPEVISQIIANGRGQYV